MKKTITESLGKSVSYETYRSIISDLLLENKSTGHRQTADLTHYSKMNVTRMNRLEKTVDISEANKKSLQNLETPYTWLVISEGWCGDAAQVLPVLHKLAQVDDKIDLRIVLRDDNPELMDLFLTNGTRSIPKLVVLDGRNDVRSTWGPRPKGAVELVTNYKKENGIFDDIAKTELQLWYTKDKGQSVQDEMAALMADL